MNFIGCLQSLDAKPWCCAGSVEVTCEIPIIAIIYSSILFFNPGYIICPILLHLSRSASILETRPRFLYFTRFGGIWYPFNDSQSIFNSGENLRAVTSRLPLYFLWARTFKSFKTFKNQNLYFVHSIVRSLRLRPWGRLFKGVNPANPKGEAWEGKRWSFEQSLERWRHQYQQSIPSHPIPKKTW